jgi:hypothetical protein
MRELCGWRANEYKFINILSTSDNNKRIAQNTLMLYGRTITIMLISLYASNFDIYDTFSSLK